MSAPPDEPAADRAPRVSVVVAARDFPPTLARTLDSLARQQRVADLEVLLADGGSGELPADAAVALSRLPQAQCVRVREGNLPALKAAAIAAARGELVAMLDPHDAAEPDWIDRMLAAFADPQVAAVGGAVLLPEAHGAANVAAYLFEYGAFAPPLSAGPTAGDLPGNNVAYRRAALVDGCADILAAEGFNKPFVHERLRAQGRVLLLCPPMRVAHLTRYRFAWFARRRFHYGRCFGALRVRRAAPGRRAYYRILAPAALPLLVLRHLRRAWAHPAQRRQLPRAGAALAGIALAWGAGEWIGTWLGAGGSCRQLY